MNYKSRLIFLFILIAIIPVIALSAVSAYTVLKFKDQLSTMYYGVSLNQATLQEASQDLQSTRINLMQYIGSQNANQQAGAVAELNSNSDSFITSFANYEEISSFPMNIEFVSDEGIEQMILKEQQILSAMSEEWTNYHSDIEDLTILSTEPGFRQASLENAAKALATFDELDLSFQDLIALNTDLAEASYDASNTVVRLAYFYVTIAAAISAACATGAAILVSKRVILGDLVKKTKIEMVETTLRDLLGEGADLILEVVKKEMPEGKAK